MLVVLTAISSKKALVADIKSRVPDLKEKEIEGLLYLLVYTPHLTNADFVRSCGLPKETVRLFKQAITPLLILEISDQVQLLPDVKTALMAIKLTPYMWSLTDFKARELDPYIKDFENLRRKFNLEPKREFDQFFATAATSLAKALLLKEKGLTLSTKSIALIGDDDLVSIALLLLGERPKELVVFDVDPDILQTIQTIASTFENSCVRTEIYDARHELRKEFTNRFDAVMTDPPYTKSGIGLFTDRAIHMLKDPRDASGSYLFLCYGGSFKDPAKTLKIQELIQKRNLVIEDKIDKFNSYIGAESMGSQSSMYVLKKTPFTYSLTDYSKVPIYTFENESEDSFPFVDHFIFKLVRVPATIMKSKKELLKLIGKFCETHRLNVIDTTITPFRGGGFTAVFVLAVSNLTVHTWPEKQALHLDLIVCTPIYKKELFAQTLTSLFKTQYLDIIQSE